MNKLEIKYVNINDVIPYEKNPRKNKEAIPLVMKSIEKFGFRNPIILDKNNVIVAGHTRLEAAKKLNIEEVPVLYADDLDDEQIKAFRLADNKVAEVAKWDMDDLADELDDIINIDMQEFGFELPKIDDEDEEDGDIQFTEVLGEEHNYIVLYFDNEVDWLQAESLFDLKPVYNLSTRKDGKLSKGMKTTGIGRVIKGREAIDKIMGVQNEN